MPSISRYLITTADERTWKFDRPVIFLGEWCCRYNRKHIWQNMDAIVAKPYGLSQNQKDSDYEEVCALETKLFPLICNIMNQYHGTAHDLRFWKILIGHWFQRYLKVVFNRVKTLEQCEKLYKLSGMAILDNNFKLPAKDSNSAIWSFNDDSWNNKLYAQILNFLDNKSYPIEKITSDAGEGFKLAFPKKRNSIKQIVRRLIYFQLDYLSRFFTKNDDAFIINSYLQRVESMKLHLELKQVPNFFNDQEINQKEIPNNVLRNSLSDKLAGEVKEDILFQIIKKLVFELMPICYLESYSSLIKKVQKLPWPANPKFIFTSNDFDRNELFKLYTANKVEAGFKYITGQHGNNYGTYRYMKPSIEELTSDKFLTWGWTDGLPQHTPAFIFKEKQQQTKLFNPSGGLLLIEDMLYHRMDTWDRDYEFKSCFENNKKFVGKLNKKVRESLVIRVHPSQELLRSFAELRWNDYDSKINVNSGGVPIKKLVAKSRLVIHAFDSTGILETLTQNIPTLAFWENDLDHLRDSALPYYQVLIDAGIIHLTSDSVSSKTNEIWDDIEAWWRTDTVQDARIIFCERYSKLSQNHSRDLIKLLD